MNVLLGAGLAFWLGVLTSISPCPLASNIAAMSWLARRVESARLALLSGILYTLGRATAYILIAVLLSASLLSAGDVSLSLQKWMGKLLGPLLVLVSMLLLELVPLGLGGGALSDRARRWAESSGALGSLIVGFLFALSFCPVSAALFFGSLIPLALREESPLLLPMVYGLGTALPVAAFGVLIALGVRRMGGLFQRIGKVELWARRITGVIILLIGIWLTITGVFLS